MNKKVIYYDGKIIVLDEEGIERPMVYTNNFEKILVQENVIEECENIIRCLEKESDRYKKLKLMERLEVAYPFLAFTFFPPIFLTLMNKGDGISNTEVVETMLGQMTTNELIMTLSQYFIPLGLLGSLIHYNSYTVKEKDEVGNKVCLEFLRKYLTLQKEILQELKEDMNASNLETGFKVYNIDDNKFLNELYRYRDLFYDLGYTLKRNIKSYEKTGELSKKLDRSYSDEEKIKAKEYLEEKGKTLRKGRK